MPDDGPFDRLMTDLQDGDPDAARAVFDRFARRLAAFAAARLPAAARARVDPEDVAQSVLRTFCRRHQDGQFHPDHWDARWSLLAVLTARKCGHQIGHLFAARRDARREVGPAPVGTGSQSGWIPPDSAPSPSEVVAFEETMAQVLAGLKDRERAVVELRLEGFTIPEVAERTGMSERSAHRVLSGVRARLEAAATD